MQTDYPVFKARLVMGSPTTLRTKTHDNIEEPNENKHHWFMGFAVPKGPEWDAIYSAMYNNAANDPECTAALCGQAGFNWKTDDCDAPENPRNLGKASYPAGHMLIKFSRYKQMGPPELCDGNYQQIINPNAIKTGDYFQVSASTKFNGAKTVKTNAGMYQNIHALMFAGEGEAIISENAFDAKTAFAGVQGATVQGGQSAPAQQAPVTPAQQAPVTPAQQAPVTPAHDLVQPGGVTAAPALPVIEPVEEKFNVRGQVYTKSQLLAMPGWTEAHLVGLTPA